MKHLLQMSSSGQTELLHGTDAEALRQIQSLLHDLPGSPFFSTWDFALDPCVSFLGIICVAFDGNLHVVSLHLGSSYAGVPGIEGTISPYIGNLTYLKQLVIMPGAVTGEMPSDLGKLSRLEFLGIQQNKILGCIPESLGLLLNLEVLDLDKNLLDCTIPNAIADLPNLRALRLSGNNLRGQIPAFKSRITHLDLSINQFSGGLPALPVSLEYLSLSKNSLTGSLDALSSLSSLNFLDVSLNKFSGSIPSSIFGFTLSALYLQRNMLSGAITVQAPVNISLLDSSYNYLSGHLPPLLATVEKLYLNNNRFSGSVPQRYVENLLSSQIQILYLQHNYLTAFHLSFAASLPLSSLFCIQYNCLIPPPQSSCPFKSGKQIYRPFFQCSGNHDR